MKKFISALIRADSEVLAPPSSKLREFLFILQVTEYDHAAKLATEAITEAVARHLHDLMIEKEQR